MKLTASTLPNILKHATVRPVYKKDSKNKLQNYRPVNILNNLSKVCEKFLFNEMATHFDNILSIYHCGFRKGFNSQQFLIVLVEKWKKNRDRGGSFAAVLTDLSKSFYCLLHYLLIEIKINLYSAEWKETEVQHK